MVGIYKITNLKNNKCYIGQAYDIERRQNEHKMGLKSNIHLQSSVKKYGIENFKFEVIEECGKDKLNEREIYWISYYDSYNNGYNNTIGGDGFKGKHSPKSIEKMRKNSARYWNNKKLSNEMKSKISIAHKGKPTWNKGIKCPQFTGENHPMYGKHHSKESIEKMRESTKGTMMSEETKAKLSLLNSGSNNAFYGKKHSEETKKKMSERKMIKFMEKYPKELAIKINDMLNNGCSKYRICKELDLGKSYYILHRIIDIYKAD